MDPKPVLSCFTPQSIYVIIYELYLVTGADWYKHLKTQQQILYAYWVTWKVIGQFESYDHGIKNYIALIQCYIIFNVNHFDLYTSLINVIANTAHIQMMYNCTQI